MCVSLEVSLQRTVCEYNRVSNPQTAVLNFLRLSPVTLRVAVHCSSPQTLPAKRG